MTGKSAKSKSFPFMSEHKPVLSQNRINEFEIIGEDDGICAVAPKFASGPVLKTKYQRYNSLLCRLGRS
jgi:hypothetical protein